MRHLKKFEEVDYDQLRDQIHGDFYGSQSAENNNDDNNQACPDCGDDVATCDCVDYEDEMRDYVKPSNQEPEIYGSDYNNTQDSDCDTCEHEEEEEEEEYKPWGDENIKLERFSTFNEKKKAPKKDDKKKKDDEKTPKKPDFKDFDKDGDKKEPMTKALKDKEAKEEKGDKKFEKPKKGEMPAGLKKFMDKKKK